MRKIAALAAVYGALAGYAEAKRLLTVDDVYAMSRVSDAQCSPDGNWVAYVVETVNKEDDKHVSNVWMASWDGSAQVQMTYETKESVSSPFWSSDGRYLSFVSSRPGPTKGSQVWVMDRRGGEARQLTHLKDKGLTSYRWSPDGKKLVLVLKEKEHPEPEEGKPEIHEPVDIDRYHFKEDMEGYLSGKKRNHIYLFDVESGKLDQVTTGDHDETDAVQSPDGSKIAYVSGVDPDPDRTLNTDVFVMDAKPGSSPRRLTTYAGPDHGPLAWSPDSKAIAYLQGSESKLTAYNLDRLALASVDGGPPRVLSGRLDRDAYAPVFGADGKTVSVLVPDDRLEYPVAVSVTAGTVQRLLDGDFTANEMSSAGGHTAIVLSRDHKPDEVYAFDGGTLRQLSHHNDALIDSLDLGDVKNIEFHSKDGAEVHGLLTTPPGYVAGSKIPTILRIHGGPNGQDSHEFRFDNQLFAANGYAVLNVNYRGSSGRGGEYAKSIFADWGHKEVIDLLAGVDSVVASGIADPQRLGIGGWSYGAISTDYVIASDDRFKCAIAGAGSANWFGIYGIDEYTFQYDNELGYPWKNTQAWLKLSYPFFHIDRIHTPTLFMGGDKDFNVPIAGGEQMYEALKTLNVPTELVIYPGEYHGFRRPSFIVDRYKRYLAWYGKYLKTAEPAPEAAKSGSR